MEHGQKADHSVCRLNSENAWSRFIVHSRRVGGVAVCSVPGAHPVHLLRSLEVFTHPLTKDGQVYNMLITQWILLNLHCSLFSCSFYLGHIPDVLRARKDSGNDELPLSDIIHWW